MSLSKAERARVYAIFDGRCAYCGCELPARWHADHVEPVIRYPEGGFTGGKMLSLHPERDTPENYWPSCAPCNIDKHRMSIEQWRRWLAIRLAALMKTPGFRLLKAHGLVTEIERQVQFHFETVATKGMDHG